MSEQVRIDETYLVDQLTRLAKVPTDVPLGYDTLLPPDAPRLVEYVQRAVRPALVELGFYELQDVPKNNLLVHVGGDQGDARCLLLMGYTSNQHHNLMAEPYSGRIALAEIGGRSLPCVYGQGVSQSKAHQAVMLAVLKAIRDAGVHLKGHLVWAVNNEARSTHDCTYAILYALGQQPDAAVLQTPTRLAVSLGNRGRLDINVRIAGRTAHSSTPDAGANVLEAVADVVTRLRTLAWSDAHELLGSRHAVAYKVQVAPLAPHTLPDRADLTIDRRLLPGDDPKAALAEVEALLGDMKPFEIAVSEGPLMLPALTDPEQALVVNLRRAMKSAGVDYRPVYGPGTFDAGGPASRGIPTVMFGAGGDGDWPLGDDLVSIESVRKEADTLLNLVLHYLGVE